MFFALGHSYTGPSLYEAVTKSAEIFTGRSQHGACVMRVWLAAACPKTLIVTQGVCWSLAMPKSAPI